MAFTAIVGDVHGCAAELEELLEHVHFTPGRDRLVLVGDLVVRGPDSHGVLALALEVGASAVRGNHEHKLIEWRKSSKPLPAEHAQLALDLSEREWHMLEAMPLWMDLPDHGLRVVHGGVLPNAAPEFTPPEALLKMRTTDARGRWSAEPDAGPLWGSRYAGPPHVVFGHNARAEPQLHSWATGLDTGCVYGGRLTAAVLAEGEMMPRGQHVRSVLRSVPARRRYSLGRAGAPLE